ncbi:hypothetical protein AVEN_16720-1 [Araneus ventricosus]|uniref:Zinc finger PHD-type domain-containing protein n=1 Tax=Araneus ventricosus TaxID=182803 RepID=A0A4Y2JXC0_ARAVE|nr:hypothetical protein AVEN_16720-1 [Araneus ventricosus]
MYVITEVLFHDVSGCIGHNVAVTSTTILNLSGPLTPVANEQQMEEVSAVLENDSSTTTSPIEDFPNITASKDILEVISPLNRRSNKDRKRKKSVQVKRSKLITPRTSKEDLKMEAKMELKTEDEESEGDEETHCIICAETFGEDWIQCRICEGSAHQNCANLEGNNMFYECDVYFNKKIKTRMHLCLKRIVKFPKTDNCLIFQIYTSFSSSINLVLKSVICTFVNFSKMSLSNNKKLSVKPKIILFLHIFFMSDRTHHKDN